ncbi:MAG: hypothetical protein ACLPV8_18120 [Steroidobacteraceae bacterium]
MSNTQTDGKIQFSSTAHITHDALGNVISVGRVPVDSRVRVEVKPRNKAHSVLEVELNAEQDSMSVLELHKTHRVHLEQKKLVKK